jgi:hypothetical protein
MIPPKGNEKVEADSTTDAGKFCIEFVRKLLM